MTVSDIRSFMFRKPFSRFSSRPAETVFTRKFIIVTVSLAASIEAAMVDIAVVMVLPWFSALWNLRQWLEKRTVQLIAVFSRIESTTRQVTQNMHRFWKHGTVRPT